MAQRKTLCRLNLLSNQSSEGGLSPHASDAGSGSGVGSFTAFFDFALGAFSSTGSAVSTGVSMTLPPITVLTIFVAIKLSRLIGV